MMKSPRSFLKSTPGKLISVALVIALAVTATAYIRRRNAKDPLVRTAVLGTGDIASRMYVKARIQPGAVEQYAPLQRQRVLTVEVKPGDQVAAGDVLLTLDRSELLKLYDDARKTRIRLETEAAGKTKEEKAREEELAKARAEYEQQVALLTGSLTGIVTKLSLLSATPSSNVVPDPDLQAQIAALIAGLDPESEDFDAALQALMDTINEGIGLTDNPQYDEILTGLQEDVNILSDVLPKVLTGVGSSFTSGLDVPLQISPELIEQLGVLGLNAADPLVTARQNELLYKKMYEESLDRLIAKGPGIVAAVNTEPDAYALPLSSSALSSVSVDGSSAGLDALLSGMLGTSLPQGLGGTSVSSAPAVLIYDNTRPIAKFSVSQFDSARIRVGLPVEYSLGGKSYNGFVSYKSLFVPNAGFDTQSSNDLLREVGIVSGADQEPQLSVEMSIQGQDLTELTLGFLIDAEIQTAAAADALILPAEAMRRELNVYYVYVVDADRRLVRRVFVPGIQSDMFVEVVSGLSKGDRVVLNPGTTLSEGMLVRYEEP